MLKAGIRSFFKENWKFLIVIGVYIFTFYGLDYFRWHVSVFKKIFFDGNGTFQWIGVSSLLGLVTLFFSTLNNRRSVSAEVISKNRIQWIKEIRPKMAQYLAKSSSHQTAVKMLADYYLSEEWSNPFSTNAEEYSQKRRQEIQKLYYDIKELREFLLAALSKNNENKTIRDSIEDVYNDSTRAMREFARIPENHTISVFEKSATNNGKRKRFTQRGSFNRLSKTSHADREALRNEVNIYLNGVWHEATNPYRTDHTSK